MLANKDSKKIKALIRKLKTLSERGEKNEREVAKSKLTELMSKYKITKFEESKIKNRVFKLVDFDDCRVIMTHCILDTDNNASIDGNKQKKELYCNLKDEQYIDVCQKFNHYYGEYIKQKNAFLGAFILSNNLGIVESKEHQSIDVSEGYIDDVKEMLSKVKPSTYKNPYLIAS